MRRAEVEAELRWFFSQADGEMGLKSNFSGIVARLEGLAGNAPVHHIDTRRLEAADRARRIESKLRHVSKYQRAILFAAYAYDKDDRLARVMTITHETAEAHKESRSIRPLGEWLSRLLTSVKKPVELERRRVFARIHSAAVKSIQEALDAFSHQSAGIFG